MRTRAVLFVVLAALLYVVACANAAPAALPAFTHGALVSPRANAYRSRRTLMPLNYYSVGVCNVSKAKMEEDKAKEDLGEILMGNRLVPTPFEFKFGVEEQCKQLCDTVFDAKNVRRANYLIRNRYDTRMFLDGVPLVSSRQKEGALPSYRLGVSFGVPSTKAADKKTEVAIYNHFDFTVRYTDDIAGGYQIVGFHVAPRSVSAVTSCDATAAPEFATTPMLIPVANGKQSVAIKYTYSVTWERNAAEFTIAHSVQEAAQRRGHLIASLYGVLLTVLVGVVVAFVMLRTVRKDLAIYLDEELNEEEIREESGWKLVRGDVFRAPPYAVVLSTLIGAGSQIAVTVFATMLLCATKFVDPAVRGHFLTTIITVFLFTHAVAGFVTSRFLKLFGMTSWKTALLCMAAFPFCLGGGILTLNFLHWMKHTTAAIPFGTIISMLLVWVMVSLPIGAVGVYAGYTMDTLAITAKVSSIPRLIPMEAGGRTLYYAIFGSFVPFVACCVEMSYVLNAFWREEKMYMFGLVTFFLFTISVLCVEVGIVVTYFTLRDEDYRWWWRSFGTLAASGVYVFLYSIYFLVRVLEIRLLASMILFLAYMFGVAVMFGAALGTISFLGSFWLVQRMYGAIKAD